MELAGLRVPEVMIQSLLEGKEMSITLDSEIDCEVGDRFIIYAEDSAMRCEVRIARFVRGPAVEVFEAVRDEPSQSAASVLDAIAGLAMTGRPPTTRVTFLRVEAVLPMA